MSETIIESLDHDGKGVARLSGKTVFIEGALPGERIEFVSTRKKPTYELGVVQRIFRQSTFRAQPRCRYFGICGGCSMQHLDTSVQVAAKQRVLEDALWHIARLRPHIVFPAIHGPAWAYRHRARLSVRLVPRKGGVLVGFHERKSSYVADMDSCEVLPATISALLPELKKLIGSLSISDRIPQIEVAVGDVARVLVFRILEPLSMSDQDRLRTFSERFEVQVFLQPAGPDTAFCFHPAHAPELAYSLSEFDLRLRFAPTDFTQVNHAANQVLVRRSLQLLAPRPGERIVDMFCGLGNFTLPVARRGADVVGVEGNPGLIKRAQENATANRLGDRARFRMADLFEIDAAELRGLGEFDKMLIDPPREGAIALVKSLDSARLKRLVYVSCNPATLARDAAVLVHDKGYQFSGAGIANMFPHTSHVESIALFERQ